MYVWTLQTSSARPQDEAHIFLWHIFFGQVIAFLIQDQLRSESSLDDELVDLSQIFKLEDRVVFGVEPPPGYSYRERVDPDESIKPIPMRANKGFEWVVGWIITLNIIQIFKLALFWKKK